MWRCKRWVWARRKFTTSRLMYTTCWGGVQHRDRGQVRDVGVWARQHLTTSCPMQAFAGGWGQDRDGG